MSEKMRDGIIRRGSNYSYVVVERGRFPVIDRTTKEQKRGADGELLFRDSRQRWVGGFATRKAAKDARDAARHAVNRGIYVAPQDMTVEAYLERWLAGHTVELKPSTAQSYADKIRVYLVPAIGQERVQALSPSRLSVVWRQMHEAGGMDGKPVSPKTVEFARAVLRKALEDAVVDRLVPVNHVVGSKLPKRDGKPQHTTWTGAQVQTFLQAVGESRWAPLWQLAVATGMRRGEFMALTRDRIDLVTGVVAVGRSTTQIRQERVTTTPKNHERRRINLDERTVTALRAWRKAQAEERLAWGPAYEDTEDLGFTWEDGRPVLPNYVSKLFLKVQAGVGLPRLTMHELRHTHATLLLRDRVPVHIVSKRLGHKDPSVTLNVYADVIPDDDVSAVDVFSKAVWGA
jgi:integrase